MQNRSAFTRVADCLPLLLAVCGIVFVRSALGFQFPVPWPDETGFLAQAFDLAHTGSFFDPGLNPDRVVMWMPPGYMVVLAAVFRCLGYSFSLARWVSTLFCLASLAVVVVLTWRLAAGWRRTMMAWAIGVTFASPVMLLDSNIARMEMLFCFLILLALSCSLSGRLYVAAALVAVAGLVHFNAVYFVVPVVVCFAMELWSRGVPRPDAGDWLALSLAALALSAYGVYVACNWPGFVADMRFQFSTKIFFGREDPAHPAWLVWAGVVAALPPLFFRTRIAAATAQFGVAFLLMDHEGHELWYDYGLPLGFTLILLSLTLASARDWRGRGAWTIGTAGMVILASLRSTPAMQSLLPQWRMLHRSVVAPTEIAKVRTFIGTLHAGDTVNFGWSGMEPFFFTDLARMGAHWSIVRHSVTQVLPMRAAEWRVMCDSSEWPPALFQFDIAFPRTGRDTGCDIMRVGPASGR